MSGPVSGSNYTQTRIQVRLASGQVLTETFSAKETLSAVRLFVQMNMANADYQFGLMRTHPRKVFDADDFNKPLDELGLVPSGIVIEPVQRDAAEYE